MQAKNTEVIRQRIDGNDHLRTVEISGPCYCVANDNKHHDWDKHHPEACGNSGYTSNCAKNPIPAYSPIPLSEKGSVYKKIP